MEVTNDQRIRQSIGFVAMNVFKYFWLLSFYNSNVIRELENSRILRTWLVVLASHHCTVVQYQLCTSFEHNVSYKYWFAMWYALPFACF